MDTYFLKNILLTLDKAEIIKKSLDSGREKRIKKLLRLKEEIPSLQEIIKSDKIDVSTWLNKYLLLASSGFRKISLKEKESHFSLKYKNFTRHGFKDFETKIPKIFMGMEMIKVDEISHLSMGLYSKR